MSNPLSQEARVKSPYQQRVEAFMKASEPKITQEDWQQILAATGGDAMQALVLRISCLANLGKLQYDRSFDAFANHGDVSNLRVFRKKAVRLLEAAQLLETHPWAPLGTEEGLFLAAATYGSRKSDQKSGFVENRLNHNPGHDFS